MLDLGNISLNESKSGEQLLKAMLQSIDLIELGHEFVAGQGAFH